MTKSKARSRFRSSPALSVLTGGSAALVLVAAGQPATATAQPSVWQPPAASYAASRPVHTTVTMDDGVKIAVEIVYPTDPDTGERASGTFPVLLSQNPYGTQRSDPADNGTYFVQRGYVFVASAVRGTGDSGGQVDWFGDRQGEDGAELVDWAAHTLPGSDGKVGLDGCSYLGVNQWSTAAAVGRNSALKAIAPFCTDSDFYNDLTANGGIPTGFVAGIARAEPRGPEDDPATDPQSVTIAQQADGGSRAYDDAYWQDRNVQKLMPRIVRNGIPALSEAGWQDLFPGGNLGAYVAAQNAYFGRPSTAPIRAGETVTGRYQAIVGPWTHGEHVDEAELQAIRLEWFETWLKDAPTGMADTSTPLHLFENGAGSWTDSAAWPLSPQARTYYLGDGSLTAARPSGRAGDRLSWAASTSSDGSLTYTTAPLTDAALLDGPADVTVYAAATTTETELSATLGIVAPDGTVTKQADGVLLGSQRAVDTGQSWYGANKALLKPSHPFTQAAQRPVTPGSTTRYDVSLLPSLTRIPAGYRIRVALTSGPPADFHYPVSPTPRQLADLAAGVYTVERSADAASFVNLPLTSPGTAHPSDRSWGPAS
ncbi:CocE/NonD family hydrolase [Streptomyces sp. NPDC001980]|uniref:CocE/NonD family hydrolase n=1 Tax=Streptomyces sp. NPDC001980 TaxID=3157126 RepID=UPI003316A142